VQIAKVVTPPALSVQQSAHTGARQRAQGPAASAPHSEQRATGPSPEPMSCPVTS